MRRSKLSALARSITLLASVGAPCLVQAADLLPPPPPEPLPIEVGGGWYLRGDVGVGATHVDSIEVAVPRGTIPDGYSIDRQAISDQFFAGAGVGYQFNNFFHADITGEYRGGGKLTFNDSFGAPNNKFINVYNGNLSAVVVMANGYIDLGTWYGLTPFIGAGVGHAWHHLGDFNDTGFGAASGGYGNAKDKTTGSFAWAAMAGLGYSVTPNVKLEVGYRYINLGTAGSNGVNCYNNGCDTPAFYKAKDITSHDVRLGMRWLLGGIAAPIGEYVEPGPLVRKY